MGLKFNPPKAVARYALFVNSPKPTFKAFDDLGSAKNAYHARGHYYDSKILENVDGEWYTLFDMPKGTAPGWQKEVSVRDWYSRSDRTVKRGVPMTRDEYAEWRVRVERERLGFITESDNNAPGVYSNSH